jgi:hypothetical protein
MVSATNVYMALQHRELKEHSYFRSKKTHRNVGLEEAIMDWCRKGSADEKSGESHAERIQGRFLKYETEILAYCNEHCVGSEDCPGAGYCKMPDYDLHKLLHDEF